MNLQNVEVLEQSNASQQNQKNNLLKQSFKYGTALAITTTAVAANAAMPEIDTADILSYIGLLVAAVATVGSATLMIFLAAKGIKAIRAAF